jgi:hypothetical protein
MQTPTMTRGRALWQMQWRIEVSCPASWQTGLPGLLMPKGSPSLDYVALGEGLSEAVCSAMMHHASMPGTPEKQLRTLQRPTPKSIPPFSNGLLLLYCCCCCCAAACSSGLIYHTVHFPSIFLPLGRACTSSICCQSQLPRMSPPFP